MEHYRGILMGVLTLLWRRLIEIIRKIFDFKIGTMVDMEIGMKGVLVAHIDLLYFN